MKPYGMELILDLHECDVSKFNRDDIDVFFEEACLLTDMVQCERYWWDDVGLPPEECQTSAQTTGSSAAQGASVKNVAGVQFILTSSIVIHTLSILKNAYINVFTCKDFDPDVVKKYAAEWFGGKVVAWHFIERI